MKIRTTTFALLQITCAVLYLTGCVSAGGVARPPACVTLGTANDITISPQTQSIPVNQTLVLTATTVDIPGQVIWSLGLLSKGALSATTGTSVTYTAPSAPPVYGFVGTNGSDSITAFAQTTGGCEATATKTLNISAPSVTVGLSPTTASVALGASAGFTGYAVGDPLYNGVIWQVNGATGGSAATGTIAPLPIGFNGATYTAPANIPMSGPTVTITMISQADPTKTQTAVVTLH
jgi:hypothetical protein